MVKGIADLGEFSQEKGGGCRKENTSSEEAESAKRADAEKEPDEGADHHYANTTEGEADDQAVADDENSGAAPALDARYCTLGLSGSLVDFT